MILSNSDLQRLKTVELDILKVFINVCDTLELKYYLIGGSALGAVRHKGFIPWDDDIDVGMKRKDYDIFVKKAQELLPSNYFIQTHDTDPNWFMHFCKIRRTDSVFVEKSVKDLNINHGIFIDVFPLDYCNKNKQPFSFRLLSVVEDGFLSNQKKIQSLKRLIAKILTFTFTVKRAFKKKEIALSRLKKGEYIANYCGSYGNKEIVPAICFDGQAKFPFENLEINIPSNYDIYLTLIYGDYMKLPPVENRIPHHYVEKLEFPEEINNSDCC